MTLQNMVNWTLLGFQQGGEGYNFKIRGKDKVKICGVEAILVKHQEQYKEKDFEETIWIDEYFFIKSGQGIILHFDTSKDAYDKFQGNFKAIAGSFSFGKKQFSPIIDEKLNPIPHKNK